jgi:aspartokinase/homoserine dehydrogenase 1
MKILKFGGSSAATPQRIKSIIEIVKPRLANEKIALIFSAFGGVTDMLINVSTLALTGDAGYKDQLAQLESKAACSRK